MHTRGLVLFFVILLFSLFASGCINLVPGDVIYKSGSLAFTIRSGEAIPDGVLEVAVFRLDGLKQVEISHNADYFPLKAGENNVTVPINLKPGNYRCFIYFSSGATRYPVVIRDFEI